MRYAHANDPHVKKGQRVKKGDILGLVVKIGLVTGAHLNFEVIRKDRAIARLTQNNIYWQGVI
jgi:murein DD-endopeptidase MepM/ murein hydrolase activator NlpD